MTPVAVIRTTAGLTLAAALITADESPPGAGLPLPTTTGAVVPARAATQRAGSLEQDDGPARRQHRREDGRDGDAGPSPTPRRSGAPAAGCGRDGLRVLAGRRGSAGSSHAERAHSGRGSGVGEKATVWVSSVGAGDVPAGSVVRHQARLGCRFRIQVLAR